LLKKESAEAGRAAIEEAMALIGHNALCVPRLGGFEKICGAPGVHHSPEVLSGSPTSSAASLTRIDAQDTRLADPRHRWA
jgi:hypothetical protein